MTLHHTCTAHYKPSNARHKRPTGELITCLRMCHEICKPPALLRSTHSSACDFHEPCAHTPTSLLASPPTTALHASRTAGPGTTMTKPTTYSLKEAKPQPSMQPTLAPYQQCAQAPNSTQEIHAQLPTPQASTIQLRNSTLRSNLIASTCVHE